MLRDFDYPALVKRFVILIAVVVVSGLSVLTVLGISASYDAMSEDYICDHAKKLLADNDPLEATEILQRLYFARGQKLKPQTLDLLAQALVNRSNLYVGRNKIEAAIKDLKDIPPDTALAQVAAQKLRLLIPKAVPSATLVETIKPVVAKPVVAKVKEVNAPAQVLAAKPAAQLPKPAFAADDVTNYNRLLAAYFEKTGVESEQPADSGSSDETSKSAKPVSEPPTLKEWVNAGRPDF